MEAVGAVRPSELRLGVQRALPHLLSVQGGCRLEPVKEMGGDVLLAMAEDSRKGAEKKLKILVDSRKGLRHTVAMMNEGTTTKGATMSRGATIKAWIDERHSEGMTVFATTALRSIKIAPKHAGLVRVNGDHCEVAQGRRWDSINYCKITASA